MRRSRILICALLSAALLTDCSGAADGSAVPSGPTTQPNAESHGPVTKLLVFVVENHSLAQMRSQMPEAFGLAKQYGYATHYRALTHPSLPNYLAIASGDTFGISDDNSPVAHVLHARAVFGQAIKAGKTAKVYAEGMLGTCALQTGGLRYAVKHNP